MEPPGDGTHLTPPEHSRSRGLLALASAVVVAILAVGFIVGIPGKQSEVVFSNISSGLNGGGDVQPRIAIGSQDTSGVSVGSHNLSVGQPIATTVPSPTPSGIGSGQDLTLGTTPAGSEIERDLNASFTVSPGSVRHAFDEVTKLASDLGGFVVSSSTTKAADDHLNGASVTVRIPTDRLSDVITGLPGDFKTSQIDFSSRDHTKQFGDATQQLKNATAKRDADLATLRTTTDAGALSTLKSDLDRDQTQVDSLTGALRDLTNQVQYSTAVIGLTERGVTPAPPPNQFTSALTSGWNNDVAILSMALLALLSALPVGLLLLPVWLRRRTLWNRLGLHRQSETV